MAYDFNTIQPDYISAISGNLSQALTVKNQHVVTGLTAGQSIFITQLGDGSFEISSPFIGTGGGSIFKVNDGLYLDSGNFLGVSGIDIIQSGSNGYNILIANGIKLSVDGTRLYDINLVGESGIDWRINGNTVYAGFQTGYLQNIYATMADLNNRKIARSYGWYNNTGAVALNGFGPVFFVDVDQTLSGFRANSKTAPNYQVVIDLEVSTNYSTWNSIFSDKPQFLSGEYVCQQTYSFASPTLNAGSWLRLNFISGSGDGSGITAQLLGYY